MKKVSFTKSDFTGNEFSVELKKRVGEYFNLSNISPKGNKTLYYKTIILFALFGILYYLLVFSEIFPWIKVVLCLILGITIASIGFNVMHDGAHGSYSSKKWINEMTGLSLNFLGGNVHFWKQKHNINHHTFTNIQDHDEDFDIMFMRTTDEQKRKWFHRYQHIYSVVLYSLIYVLWVYMTDFIKYFSGKVKNYTIKMNTKEHIIFWLSKVIHITFFIFIPLWYLPFPLWLVGFLLVNFSSGITLSVVFQLAHVMPNTQFPVPVLVPGKDASIIETNWMIHQLATTTDFATGSKIVSWFVGGLNFQVEHHLFPLVSHVHYPSLRCIVIKLCDERGIPHLEYPTLFKAISAHFSYLKQKGVA